MRIPVKRVSPYGVNRKVLTVVLFLLLFISTAAFAQGASLVQTKIGGGIGSITPVTAVIPPGASQDFIITAKGTIGYVTIDNNVVTVFRVGGINKPMAIVTVSANGKPRTLNVYFNLPEE